MKLEKKHWIIIGVVVAIIVIWYFFLRKKKTESNYGVAAAGSVGSDCNDPYCPKGTKTNPTTGYCKTCAPSTDSARITPVVPIGVVSAGMRASVESHPKCKPGTIWSDTFGKCIPDTPENIKWPSWLKIKRACPQGLVLDPVTKGCVHPWNL
jgi:hypothetical protein